MARTREPAAPARRSDSPAWSPTLAPLASHVLSLQRTVGNRVVAGSLGRASGSTWTGRRHGLDVPSVQAGHRTSRHSGARERFAVEDADLNQASNWTAESKGLVTEKESIFVEGLIVDLPSALLWSATETAKLTRLSRDLVLKAPRHPGWAPPAGTKSPRQAFMREMLEVLRGNPRHPFRFLLDGVEQEAR